MSLYNTKPSSNYILTGSLAINETYHPDIHNIGDISERNKNYNTTPNSTYYSEDEIKRMKTEIEKPQINLPSLFNNNDVSTSLFQKVDRKKRETPKQTLSNYNKSKITIEDLDEGTREVFGPSGKSLYKEKISLPPLTNTRSASTKLP